MPGWTRHPLVVTIVTIVIICLLSGGAAAGGHNVYIWAHDGLKFVKAAFGH